VVFLPQSQASRRACEQEIERSIREEGQTVLGWRDVPRDNRGLAQAARDIEPVVRQVFIGAGKGIQDTDAWSASSTSSARPQVTISRR
jgi:glutamate synthase (NADPH/NADH) large chain